MTVTIIDEFVGADGSAVDPTKWTVLIQNANGTATINSNKARLIQTAAGGYERISLEGKTTYNGGEFYAEAVMTTEVFKFSLGVGESSYDNSYTTMPINGYGIRVTRGSGIVTLVKAVNDSETVLGTVTLASFAVATTVRMALKFVSGGVEARVWRNAETKPATPTLSAVDATFTGGKVRVGFDSGDPGQQTIDFDMVTRDDLAGEQPVADYYAGPDSSGAPGSTATLVGTPPGGVWSQDSGDVATLSAPVTTAQDTRVTFVRSNPGPGALERVFRYQQP